MMLGQMYDDDNNNNNSALEHLAQMKSRMVLGTSTIGNTLSRLGRPAVSRDDLCRIRRAHISDAVLKLRVHLKLRRTLKSITFSIQFAFLDSSSL